jgi:hypothetical protein
MKLPKNMLLPILGMVVLSLFALMSYLHDSIFLDRILICSSILSVVFIGRIRDNIRSTMPNQEPPTSGSLSK